MLGKYLPQDQNDLFRMRLDQMVNMNHEMIVLSREVDWNWIENEFKNTYSEVGSRAYPFGR